ncbi:MAG: Gfo/Idh/MocA family protein, partial [Thermomicrobiales bacterium]
WHANPAFYYQPGAGPMLDMGPYYVTALVTLLGPIRRVSSSTRTISSEPHRGETITVNTPSHIAATLDFESGPIAALVTSFDTYDTDHSLLTIYGSEGSIQVPDQNTFGGPVKLLQAGAEMWEDVPLIEGYAENSRGLGVADMARAIREGGDHRASGELAYHVLDVMLATLESSDLERHIIIESSTKRPEPLASGL